MAIGEEQLNYPGSGGAEDPWPLLDRLRAEARIFELPYRSGANLVTRYEDVRYIPGHPELFSSSSVRSQLSGFAIIDHPATPDRAMNECDDPEHVGNRRIALAPLKPGRLGVREPIIIERADSLIDDFVNDGRVEFVDAFAHRLPGRLTCRLMGIPLLNEKFVRG